MGRRGWLRGVAALIAVAGLWVAASCLEAQGQGADELVALRGQVSQLYNQGKYAEAVPIAERYVALARQTHGEEHGNFATAIAWLAYLYHAQGRATEAEPLLKRSLALYEKGLGPDHPDVGNSLNNLAGLYHTQGRYAEAEPLMKRSLALYEKALGPDHPAVGTSLNNLAELYRAQGRYAEAEPLHKRSLALREKALGPDHPEVGSSLRNMAGLYQAQGRYAEAEPLFKRSLAVYEMVLGPDHPEVGTSLNNLALLYRAQDRTAEAEPLMKRSLALYEKALGPDHPHVGTALNNLAELYYDQGRTTEAEPLMKRSLALYEKALGPGHPAVGTLLNNLAELYSVQGRTAEAEPLMKRSLALREKALGPDHPHVAVSLNNLALLHRAQGRHAEAEPLHKRDLAINEKALGAEHPWVATSLGNLAWLALARSDWAQAADYWRRSTGLLQRRAARGLAGLEGGSTKSEAGRSSWRFTGLVKVTHRLMVEGRGGPANPAREMLEVAQWALTSEAATSLSQMAARGAGGSPALAGLVRERQDLVTEWQTKDRQLIAAKSEAPGKRNTAAEKVVSERLGAIDARLAAIDVQLARDFPDYAALASPKPIAVADLQADLREDEALVLFLDTDARFKPLPEETFIWVVTRTDVRWVRSELGTEALTDGVAALRCGLDAALWEDEDTSKRCRGLVKGEPKRDAFGTILSETLPFDVTRAHTLYMSLFGEVEDLIRGKHLLIVPSGPLTQLPLQVLVTAEARDNDVKTSAWLAKRHAITILPAVSSLKALRRVGKPSVAAKPMFGVGNPLLDGDPVARPWEANWAKLARERQACAGLVGQQVASATRRSRGVTRMATPGGRADLDHLRSQSPLYDTADELCAVAKALQLAPDDVLLGARATEASIKQLSVSGRLAQYRVLHFATHGTIAGEIEGTAEPGLILTPPKEQSDTDDGYLSASEVTALKLDADWVILSACNTAAGGAKGADALSGLARAFIYAGARALLVSHWAVDLAATVKLITSAVGATARDKTLGRAEALRRAMLAMIDGSEAREAHPAFWAPFIVVGEGAAAK